MTRGNKHKEPALSTPSNSKDTWPENYIQVTYTLFKPLVPKKMLCILCSVASCCTLPLAILRLATKSGQMAGFMLFWLILKNSRPKLWLNSPRNCWQGGPEVWWVVCVYAYVGFLLFLKFTSLYQNMCLSTYQINGIKIYISRNRRRPESAELWNILILFFLIKCDLGDPPTPSMRQRFLSPDILTTGRCIKKKWNNFAFLVFCSGVGGRGGSP